ncbi:unnamed protein product, partial [Prorocentrum cordatum]
VVDLSSTTEVKPTRFASADHGSFLGMSSREKGMAVEAADHVISSGASTTTATISRDYQRKNSTMRFRWIYYCVARACFDAIEWIKWAYSSAEETIDTVEGLKGECEHILELHEPGVLGPLYMSVCIMFVVGGGAYVVAAAVAVVAHGVRRLVGFPDAPRRGHRRCRAVIPDEEGEPSESDLAKQLSVVADRLAALEIKSSQPPLPPPAAPPPTRSAPSPSTGCGGNLGVDSGANCDQMVPQLLERLDRRKEIVQAGSQAATARTPPRAQEVTVRDPEVAALVRGQGDSFKDMRVMAKEKLEAVSPTVSRAIPGGVKARVAPAMVARLYGIGGWQSRINYRVLEELDASKADQEGALIDGVEKELREQLAHRALLAKPLGKLHDHKSASTKAGRVARAVLILIGAAHLTNVRDSGRVRDPLEVLPLLALPEPTSSTSERSRSRAARERAERARANAAPRSLTAPTVGRCDQLRDAAWGSATDWARSRELPRMLSERVLECHRGAHDLNMYASDAEFAFERLALRAKAGACVALAASGDDGGAPPGGEVMPIASGEATLPPAGAEPCDIKPVSPKARRYVDRFHERMALPPSQVDEADIEAVRSRADPGFRQRAARLDFAVRLWGAWMLGFTRDCKVEVAVFFVMGGAREDGVCVRRPAWDMRRVSMRFRCRNCAELWPYMVCGGVSIDEFVKELRRRRMKLPGAPSGCRYLCLVVMLMGFSWSPAICRGALEDLMCDLPGSPRRGRLTRGLIPPGFAEVAFIYWVFFIRDFASLTLVHESDETTAETVKEAARTKLQEVGLDMHKDGVGDALPLSLGDAITEQPCRFVASREKSRTLLGQLELSWLGAERRLRSCPVSLARGSGLRCCRPAFCLLGACYKFATKFEGDQTRRELWESALNELRMPCHLAPLMYTHLEPRWSEVVFATDASEASMGAVETQATRSEVKAEVDRQWRLQQLREMAGDEEEEELLLKGDDWECSKRGIPNTSGECDVPPQPLMADVFAGYGGFGEEMRSECQCETLFVDNARNPRRDLTGPSFGELTCRAILFGLFFTVHMAPPCSSFSRARRPAIRAPGRWIRGLPGLSPPRVQRVREGGSLARAAISMCFPRLAACVGFSLENPSASMIWGLPEMAKLMEQAGVVAAKLLVRQAIEAKRLELHSWRVQEVRSPPEKPRAVMDHWASLSRWHLSWKGEWAYEAHVNVQEMRWTPTNMNPADGPSRGEGVGSAEITQAKCEQKKSILSDQYRFERLVGDQLEIKGMRDDCAQSNKLIKERARAPPAGQRRLFVPMKKKWPLAFENAAAEKPVGRSSLGREQLERPLRLLIHAVQGDANKGYLKGVEPFLRDVFHKRLPSSTPGQRDIAVAADLGNR